MCREFIKNNFDEDVVCAFDNLIPGAYKADLWRYCILYKKGGVYIDIKFKCDNHFNLMDLTDKEYFVRDIKSSGEGIFNGVIVCKPNNEKLYLCIQQIVKNVNTQNYGDNTLQPTGPMLLKKYFTQNELDAIELKLSIDGDIQQINKNNVIILSSYPEYRMEQHKSNVTHHSDLWKNREIYGDKKCFS
jgi:mannosyltransferase OCH1-like enzyme